MVSSQRTDAWTEGLSFGFGAYGRDSGAGSALGVTITPMSSGAPAVSFGTCT